MAAVAEDARLTASESEPRAVRLDAPALAVIWPLLGRHIAFHRRLVDLTSSVKAALLLSQSIYWTRHGRDITRSGGWFHKTAEQWAIETGLSVKEQAHARALLRNLALLDDQRMGIPARLYFRLRLPELGARLAARIAQHPHAVDWSDRLVLAELLGPSVAFHRTLADVAGGVHAGLLLSRALHLTRLQLRRGADHWIASSAVRWFEELGLSRREQETARRDLIRLGIWEECRLGLPPRLLARIELDGLLAELANDAALQRRETRRGVERARHFAAARKSPDGESRVWHSRNLVMPNPPPQFSPFGEHCSPESAIPSICINSTSDSLQPQSRDLAAMAPVPLAGGGELVFPEGLLPEERQAAGQLLRHCAAEAQSLLDELAGRLQKGGVRGSPLAYLRGLIARADAGSFVPELAPRVAAARRERAREVARRRERQAEEQRLAAERATPEYQAKARARREQVRQILDELKAHLRTRGEP